MKHQILGAISILLLAQSAGAYFALMQTTTTHEAALILVHKGNMRPNETKAKVFDCMKTNGKTVLCRELKITVKGKL